MMSRLGSAIGAAVLAALCFGAPAGLMAAPEGVGAREKDGDAIYAYTDERGRLVHVQRLTDIPEALRASARRVDEPAPGQDAARSGIDSLFDWLGEKSGLAPSRGEPIVYRYVGTGGRTVFTNLATTVPTDQRAFARIDLRHVPLNSVLAGDLNRELDQRYAQLRASGTCEKLRDEVEAPWWQRAWNEHRPLTVCASVLLVLLLLTPFMASKGWGAPWARVLWTALPLLGFVGVMGALIRQSGASLERMETQLGKCEPGAWQAAGGLPQKFQIVTALEAEKQALAQIERESR